MILYSVDAGVARVTLNRPEKRNALSPALLAALHEAIAKSAGDPEVRVVLLAGTGRDFCSGADLAGLDQAAQTGVMSHLDAAGNMANIFLAMRNHRCPIVAAVKGRALAGGCGLATACDLILAAETAQFGYPEVKIGFVPAMVMAILRRSVSEKRAFELIAAGEIVDAREAHSIGMINRVYPDAEFDRSVEEYVQSLAAKSASALQLSKRLLYHMDGMTFEAALQAGVHGNAIARETEDARRGIQQFVKKS
jgi:methylglutaconyl-CoA hydratase